MSTFRSLMMGLPVLISICCLPLGIIAQSEQDTTAPEKPEASIELTYTESNNRTKLLRATVKTKVAETYEVVNGLTLHFYHSEVSAETLLGTASTDEHGMVLFSIPEEKLVKAGSDFTFVAAVENDEKFEDTQEEITASESVFDMTLEADDSSKMVHVSLQAMNETGNLVPLAEVEVHLYVQRLFGLLPLTADPETTDENGEVSIEFPANIPGDTAGNLIIVARVEDHERFGNLDFRRKINWGVPLLMDPHKNVRELWSSRANAPLYLIFIVNSMLFGIWGVILYIVYQVYRIKKLGRQKVA